MSWATFWAICSPTHLVTLATNDLRTHFGPLTIAVGGISSRAGFYAYAEFSAKKAFPCEVHVTYVIF
jgi:hypothetical protein